MPLAGELGYYCGITKAADMDRDNTNLTAELNLTLDPANGPARMQNSDAELTIAVR